MWAHFPACSSGRLQNLPRNNDSKLSSIAESDFQGLESDLSCASLWFRGSNQFHQTPEKIQRPYYWTQRTYDLPKKGTRENKIDKMPSQSQRYKQKKLV